MERNTLLSSFSPHKIPPGFLSELPTDAAQALLASGNAQTYPPGSVILRRGSPPRPSVVIAGRVRVFLESGDGRQTNVAYAGPGEVVGLTSTFLHELQVDVSALSEASVIHLSPAILTALMQEDSQVAMAVARQLAENLRAAYRDLHSHAFCSARQRLARQLLQLAQADVDGRPVIQTTHGQLADAIGSVREHVARLMRQLRKEGIVATSRTRVVITDMAALRQAAGARDALPQARSSRRGSSGSSPSDSRPRYQLLGS